MLMPNDDLPRYARYLCAFRYLFITDDVVRWRDVAHTAPPLMPVDAARRGDKEARCVKRGANAECGAVRGVRCSVQARQRQCAKRETLC